MHIPEKYRPGVFIFIGIFTLINIVGLFSLRFDFEIEQLFPKNDPDLEFYQEKILNYQSDKSYLLIAVESEKGVLKTKEIKIKVSKSVKENSDIKILTTINKTKPYVIPVSAK